MDTEARNQVIIGVIASVCLVVAGILLYNGKSATEFVSLAGIALMALCPSAVHKK